MERHMTSEGPTTPPPAGFTPGTYNVSKGVHDWFVLNDDGYTVAVCGSEEDAHLVCAAPDLYAACRAALNMIAPVEDPSDEVGHRVVGLLSTALAKAGGTQ